MNPTAERLLERAEETIRTRGYAGLSFRTLADDVGIKSASVHYHFPTKTHLGVAVASRYQARFGRALEQISQRVDEPQEQLRQFVDIYGSELRAGNNRLTICMMLAAEKDSLPDEVNRCVSSFYQLNLDWLSAVLQQLGDADPANRARQILALLQGAVLGSKTLTDIDYFEAAAAAVMQLVGVPSPTLAAN
ncbi:TetR/AcrR family transcriptional regulator [Saccharospirillum mangrovi]|uniref:TetR/AcrR family transcriptional regulator n=1 Tax=Saccharospirillum mangrovi TaxID=2161747 RepID=UPI000D3CAB1F|nr:TetR/AcrR family transcriptional regulator [Saccharospirillum mangrovi]